MVVWRQLILIVGFVLACGAEPDDAVDGAARSSDESSEETSSETNAKDSEKADDDACNEQDGDPSTREGALAAYARLRTSTECTTQVTRRGKPVTIEYSIK
jgi:hypothetical protein